MNIRIADSTEVKPVGGIVLCMSNTIAKALLHKCYELGYDELGFSIRYPLKYLGPRGEERTVPIPKIYIRTFFAILRELYGITYEDLLNQQTNIKSIWDTGLKCNEMEDVPF